MSTKQGEILKKAIADKGMKATSVAAMLGVSRKYLYDIFQMAELSPELLKRVETTLHIALGNPHIRVEDLGDNKAEKSKEKNKEILSTDNDNLLASHHSKNDEPMTDRLIDLLQKQHEGLLQAHRELIAKITNITLDEKKEVGKSPKHPAH